jgi:hypothetical protein
VATAVDPPFGFDARCWGPLLGMLGQTSIVRAGSLPLYGPFCCHGAATRPRTSPYRAVNAETATIFHAPSIFRQTAT